MREEEGEEADRVREGECETERVGASERDERDREKGKRESERAR